MNRYNIAAVLAFCIVVFYMFSLYDLSNKSNEKYEAVVDLISINAPTRFKVLTTYSLFEDPYRVGIIPQVYLLKDKEWADSCYLWISGEGTNLTETMCPR